ncbi:MAG: hypothetical protein ABIC91_08450 [Nanoarchaeota archaeon]|nr:hypothetical protein [Nanoarchaeota archaeon]MBU1030334.1 hypothetical protein [Nanoarchaeota archaeon]MBU1850039.1 hypothetical protein [Nanoarchaeota archaeon]
MNIKRSIDEHTIRHDNLRDQYRTEQQPLYQFKQVPAYEIGETEQQCPIWGAPIMGLYVKINPK